MNKITIVLVALLLATSVAFVIVTQNKSNEIALLKEQIQKYAKENESLKIDTEILKKRLSEISDKNTNAAKTYDFSNLQQNQIKAMKNEIERLKSEKRPDNREREDEVWNLLLTTVQDVMDVELSKTLTNLGFKPDETASCVEEYQDTLAKMKDYMLQWYRNEISGEEYDEKFLNLTREFYKNMSNSIGENKASIALSAIIPDPEYRKKMFEEK
ncbi:hypothetical protein J6Z19_06405 [bacterium]|nr:hypothetical protein [bacterium]